MWERLVAQRRLVAWLALVSLLVGGGMCLLSSTQRDGAGGSLLRVGLVLGTLWLALPVRYVPSGKSLSIWQGLGVLSVMVAVVKSPWVVLPLLAIMGVLRLFMRPRT